MIKSVMAFISWQSAQKIKFRSSWKEPGFSRLFNTAGREFKIFKGG
jgi:hypothetical protein